MLLYQKRISNPKVQKTADGHLKDLAARTEQFQSSQVHRRALERVRYIENANGRHFEAVARLRNLTFSVRPDYLGPLLYLTLF